MKRPLKVTLTIVAFLAIIAGSIAIGPGWSSAIGTVAIILIVIIGMVVDHLAEK